MTFTIKFRPTAARLHRVQEGSYVFGFATYRKMPVDRHPVQFMIESVFDPPDPEPGQNWPLTDFAPGDMALIATTQNNAVENQRALNIKSLYFHLGDRDWEFLGQVLLVKQVYGTKVRTPKAPGARA